MLDQNIFGVPKAIFHAILRCLSRAHAEQKTKNHSNKNIDIEKTHLNYSILDDNNDTLSRLQKRHVFHRAFSDVAQTFL